MVKAKDAIADPFAVLKLDCSLEANLAG